MVLGRSVRALERLLGGLRRSVGGSWRGLGCHVETQDGSESTKKLKKSVASRGRWFRSGFLMVFWSKISSQGDPKSVFERRNLNVKCISAFSAQTQHSARVGCQHGPMLTSKIPENHGPGGVRASLGRCWKAPGGSVALPGRSGEVAGGFGEVLGRF